MPASQHVVITGSTRGIGYGLARAFLERGCSVTVGGRGAEATAAAAEKLAAEWDARRVLGRACDVRAADQVGALWDAAQARFGRVDIWINNAGHSGEQGLVWERPADELQAVIAANLLGVVCGSQVAARGMLAQGGGAIYNMEGMGSDGRKHAGLTLYGTSKYAVHYFTESLALELKGSPVIAGALRPGMVVTDLILDRYRGRPQDFARVKRIFNILADRVENVAPWLAGRILANRKNGAVLAYLSRAKLLWRFASSPFVKRDVFAGLLDGRASPD